MKKNLIISLTVLASVLLTSCTEERIASGYTSQEPNSLKVEKAINELNHFLQTMEIQTTRSGNTFTVDDVQYVTRHMGTTRTANDTANDTILYLVNFGASDEDGGYAILNAKENTDMRVLAVVEKGSITAEDFIFQDTTSIPNFQVYNEEADDYYVGTAGGGSEANQIVHFAAAIDPGFESGSSESIWNFVNAVEPMLETKWHQDHPFNDESPIVSGQLAPAGCVAIALGQILAYHEYPRNIIFDGMTCCWDDMKAVFNKKWPTVGTEHQQQQVARFIRTIGKLCNMVYYSNDSGTEGFGLAFPSAAEDCLADEFGYSNVRRVLEYDEEAIIQALDNGCPVFIAAVSGVKNGHAWVIDGYKCHSRTLSGETDYRYYVHCNWGWGGICNGYYHSGVFNLNAYASAVEWDESPQYRDRNYDHLFRTITYGNPNK